MSVFFLGLMIRVGEKINSRLIRVVADTSFGVFFIHSYVLTFAKLGTEQLFEGKITGSLLLYPVVTLSILLVCVAFIVLLQKMLGAKSRYFVGS